MMNLRTLALSAIGLCTIAFSGCSYQHSEVDALNQVQPTGGGFTQHLAEGYRQFANYLFYDEQDHPDGIHFARKGLAAAGGDAVLPEPLSDWDIGPAALNELGSARSRLLAVYDIGARQIAPQKSAMAQTRFDCWIEFEEEHGIDETSTCKSDFMALINELESMITPPPMPAPVAPKAAAPLEVIEPMTPEEAMYLVFFDFDSYDVGPGGSSVLDAVAEEARARGVRGIYIVGHTDRAGPEKYNDKLARKRADAVRTGLISRGISADIIRTEGRGENELLVSTPDNVREPANRRAQITFD